MTVAVATLGCARKLKEGFPSWPVLFKLDGDYTLYFNFESSRQDSADVDLVSALVTKAAHEDDPSMQSPPSCRYALDSWIWDSSVVGMEWRRLPGFDQDQARLSPIVMARNMCLDYAYQTNASHLLFIDADIIPPVDIIPKLLNADKLTVGGLVYGRGVHKDCPYIFGEKRRFQQTDEQGHSYTMTECEHGNIGFCMIQRKVFEQIRFRYGMAEYPDGRRHVVSDDPAYHLDAFVKFGEPHYIRMDVIGQHIGDLKADEISQF